MMHQNQKEQMTDIKKSYMSHYQLHDASESERANTFWDHQASRFTYEKEFMINSLKLEVILLLFI